MDLMDEYIKQALEYGRLMHNLQKTTKEIVIIDKITKKLYASGNLKLLIPLMDHGNPYIEMLAASSLLELVPKEAEEKLKLLEKTSDTMAGFEAKWILREWRDGNFKHPYNT